jgi:hypothetical protein
MVRSKPLPPTGLIGRSVDLRAIAELPSGSRLVGVDPGGVGKTRLAIELARHEVSRWPDRRYVARRRPAGR